MNREYSLAIFSLMSVLQIMKGQGVSAVVIYLKAVSVYGTLSLKTALMIIVHMSYATIVISLQLLKSV